MRYWCFFAVASVLLVTAAHPQRPGDFVGYDGTGLVTIDRQTSRVWRPRYSSWIVGTAIAADNQALAVVVTIPPLGFIHLGMASPATGALTTLNYLGYDPGITGAALALDQDGSYVVALRSSLLRVSGSTVSTLATFSPPPSDAVGLVIDADNGDYIVARHQCYLRVDRTRGTVSTMRCEKKTTWGLEQDLRSGHLWTIMDYDIHLIHRLTGQSLQTITTGGVPRALAVEQDTSQLFAAGSVGLQGAVIAFDPRGVGYRGWYYGTAASLRSLHFYGERKLSGSGSALPGSTYGLDLRFPASPGAVCCCALSFAGLRPGIAIGQRKMHVQVDPLFFATSCGGLPGITTGFMGRLDASGVGRASFRILPGIPPGTRITVAAAAFNPSLPDGFDIAPSLTVIVN